MIALQEPCYEIYKAKYQLKERVGTVVDESIDDTFERVASALASVEDAEEQEYYYDKFLFALQNGALPAGRIMSNAGAEELKPNTSLINCTVSGNIPDNITGIGQAVKEAMETLSKGCGIGYCFSSLRPKGALVGGVGATTSGSLSFMNIFDSACFTISSAGGRRGAEMATMHVWHPDIIDFINAKRESGRFTQFNLSVLITDEFMNAVEKDKEWQLYFPVHPKEFDPNEDYVHVKFPFPDDDYIKSCYSYTDDCFEYHSDGGYTVCKIYKTLPARELWDLIMESTYKYAEPGIIVIDRYNKENQLGSVENIVATNPCGK